VFEKLGLRRASALDVAWILLINRPPQWVILDVFSDPVKIGVVSDDVFIIIPLPDRDALRLPHQVDCLGRLHLESSDYLR